MRTCVRVNARECVGCAGDHGGRDTGAARSAELRARASPGAVGQPLGVPGATIGSCLLPSQGAQGIARTSLTVAVCIWLSVCMWQAATLLQQQRDSVLPTRLRALDAVLGGGIPSASLTEIVGAAGVGKSQFNMMLSALAATTIATDRSSTRVQPAVVYISTEAGFSAARLAELVEHSLVVQGLSGDELAHRVVASMEAVLVHQVSTFDEFKHLYVCVRAPCIGDSLIHLMRSGAECRRWRRSSSSDV